MGVSLDHCFFLVYINDLPSVLVNSFIKIFADDSKLYFMFDRSVKYDLFVHDIRKVFGWVEKNGLSVAMHKCELLNMGSKNPGNEIIINGIALPCV